jgi:hypothetical protein
MIQNLDFADPRRRFPQALFATDASVANALAADLFDIKPRRQTCLHCRQPFLSAGAHNWRCDTCRD